ncbi:MAG: hypothetical protein RL572_139 [Pseudomonadota bacterium]|jgi:hypothetical protein
MSASNASFLIWNQVLFAAETIEATPQAEARQVALEKLATLAVAFGEEADPVENFEAFVMLRLCAALQRCVQPEADAPAEH